MTKIAIAGACGRMGLMLIEQVLKTKEATLVGAFDRPGHDRIGQDAGSALGVATGVMLTDDAEVATAQANVLIDFTIPGATLHHLALARNTGLKLVIGTTGFSQDQRSMIAQASADTAIVFAPNMGVGVNATLKLLEVAARILDQGYDIEVIEAHHNQKVDAPSGTALEMGRVLARAMGQPLEGDGGIGVFERHGHTGARRAGSIGFATIRGGDIVGDHTVLFAGTGERIEITHRSTSRVSYAVGAVRACMFLAHHKTGLFDMQDVLGLKAL
jgi:4-hydroxy-tetrahydrodipicolinate reductase